MSPDVHLPLCAPGCAPCVPWKKARHPFLDAAEAGHADVVQTLLNKHLVLMRETTMRSRLTAWHLAAQGGHVEVLKVLADAIIHGPEASQKLSSSLRRALSTPRSTSSLLAEFLAQRTRGGYTPLMCAVLRNQLPAVEYLLSIGADVWQGDENGMTALHHAAKCNYVHIISELVRNAPPPTRGASRLNADVANRYVDVMDDDGWTPLHTATYCGSDTAMSLLISYDANLIARTRLYTDRAKDMPAGVSPLHIASSRGSLQLVRLVLRAYYESSADLIPSQTAMMATVERRRRQRSHPDPRLILTRTGRLPYHLAHRNNHTHLFEWLDPSIPLMFLFAGAGDEQDQFGAGVATSLVIGVPRLTVIAANAVHDHLMTQITQVEEQVVKARREEEAENERRRLQRLEAEAIAAKMKDSNWRKKAAKEEKKEKARKEKEKKKEKEKREKERRKEERAKARRKSMESGADGVVRDQGASGGKARRPSKKLLRTSSAGHPGQSSPSSGARGLLQRITRGVGLGRQDSMSDQSVLDQHHRLMGITIPADPERDHVAILGRARHSSVVSYATAGSTLPGRLAQTLGGGGRGGRLLPLPLRPAGRRPLLQPMRQSDPGSMGTAASFDDLANVLAGREGSNASGRADGQACASPTAPFYLTQELGPRPDQGGVPHGPHDLPCPQRAVMDDDGPIAMATWPLTRHQHMGVGAPHGAVSPPAGASPKPRVGGVPLGSRSNSPVAEEVAEEASCLTPAPSGVVAEELACCGEASQAACSEARPDPHVGEESAASGPSAPHTPEQQPGSSTTRATASGTLLGGEGEAASTSGLEPAAGSSGGDPVPALPPPVRTRTGDGISSQEEADVEVMCTSSTSGVPQEGVLSGSTPGLPPSGADAHIIMGTGPEAEGDVGAPPQTPVPKTRVRLPGAVNSIPSTPSLVDMSGSQVHGGPEGLLLPAEGPGLGLLSMPLAAGASSRRLAAGPQGAGGAAAGAVAAVTAMAAYPDTPESFRGDSMQVHPGSPCTPSARAAAGSAFFLRRSMSTGSVQLSQEQQSELPGGMPSCPGLEPGPSQAPISPKTAAMQLLTRFTNGIRKMSSSVVPMRSPFKSRLIKSGGADGTAEDDAGSTGGSSRSSLLAASSAGSEDEYDDEGGSVSSGGSNPQGLTSGSNIAAAGSMAQGVDDEDEEGDTCPVCLDEVPNVRKRGVATSCVWGVQGTCARGTTSPQRCAPTAAH
eukprot:CAMPEP_0202897776 /NCGR_PEP_ID=MMETSP1392-20130828/6466_1 /ASSEMBLY_ACC=CAM_ASM_000868 /TAXON_ID=225041 /ORGANISM="Chlamydomonas chlamydogama, Strain SAG 11-48b" /LENGTH=1220 /DNA_ID=CAMNT_0049583519 /DNA_START=338 /DNA_END=4001 /DNA_ORIENTATION=+